jgi:large subunit ribosomal protein L6
MSRVAKAPIFLPTNVKVSIENSVVSVQGPKGTLTQKCHNLVSVSLSGEQVNFGPSANDSGAWAQAGTMRALVNNMVHGVVHGVELTLELVGVGYRAQAKPGSIALSLGFSHPLEYSLPKGVTAETPSNTVIILKGIDKQLVGQVASEIRAYRSPEPYKGKGIRYSGEIIILKETKKK